MILIEYVGHIGLRSLTDGHLERHLEYFKTLNDARVASLGFIKYNASTTRINKKKTFKIKFQVILVFYRTNWVLAGLHICTGSFLSSVVSCDGCNGCMSRFSCICVLLSLPANLHATIFTFSKQSFNESLDFATVHGLMNYINLIDSC